ncbi:MAG: hypothetical protein ACFKPT_30390 [Gloeotrichia echinulata GP01]
MIIADINYLEVTTEEVVGGDGFKTAVNFILNKTVNQAINETTNKTFAVTTTGLGGNLAEVSGSSDASGGSKAVAQIVFATQTTNNSANALVNSTAYTQKH